MRVSLLEGNHKASLGKCKQSRIVQLCSTVNMWKLLHCSNCNVKFCSFDVRTRWAKEDLTAFIEQRLRNRHQDVELIHQAPAGCGSRPAIISTDFISFLTGYSDNQCSWLTSVPCTVLDYQWDSSAGLWGWRLFEPPLGSASEQTQTLMGRLAGSPEGKVRGSLTSVEFMPQ